MSAESFRPAGAIHAGGVVLAASLMVGWAGRAAGAWMLRFQGAGR